MNKIQWFIFGAGFLLLSGFLFKSIEGLVGCSIYEGDMLITCTIRRYAYAIPAIISHFLGWIFIICGFFEKGKKK